MSTIRSLLAIYGLCLVGVVVCGAIAITVDFLLNVGAAVFHVEQSLERGHGA